MRLSGFRSGALVALLLVTLLVGIGVIVGQGVVKAEREAYARGVRVAVLHFQCRGSFPSSDYVERAFVWGDPRDCEEVKKIDEQKPTQN